MSSQNSPDDGTNGGDGDDVDVDGDGLNFAQEAELGTSPYCWDTDGDGNPDGLLLPPAPPPNPQTVELSGTATRKVETHVSYLDPFLMEWANTIVASNEAWSGSPDDTLARLAEDMNPRYRLVREERTPIVQYARPTYQDVSYVGTEATIEEIWEMYTWLLVFEILWEA